MPTGAALLALLAAALPHAGSASAWVQRKCAGELCTDPKYPILDYSGLSCICRQHPCWNDDGRVHRCPNPVLPYLAFAYMADGKLVCSCQKFPHVGSIYLAQRVCPGSSCTEEGTPMLEFSEDTGKCICSSNPCLNHRGVKHTCEQGDYPILSFSYDKNETLQCGCSKKFHPPEEKEL